MKDQRKKWSDEEHIKMNNGTHNIINNFDDIADKFYLPRIVEGSLRTEIAIHSAFFSQQPYAQDEIDKTWIAFLNRGIYHRPFSRVTLLARVQNAWYSLKEVSSMLHASEKTCRNIFAECRDLEMVDHKYEGNRLVIQSSQRGIDMYYRYVKSLYDVHNPMRKEYLKNIQEYQRLKKWGTYLEGSSKKFT